jgi:hypothetical protein
VKGKPYAALERPFQQAGPAQVQAMQAPLRQQVAPNLDLIVRSVVGGEASAAGYLPVEGRPE